MPRGPAPAWRARKPPIADGYILAAIDQAGGLGKHDPQTGHYGTLVIRGLADRDEAAEWKSSLYRCAHFLSRHGIAPVSISQADIERDGASWKITFRVSDKTMARKYQLENRGTDRSKWSYDPRRGGT
jgi:hypothetical protein